MTKETKSLVSCFRKRVSKKGEELKVYTLGKWKIRHYHRHTVLYLKKVSLRFPYVRAVSHLRQVPRKLLPRRICRASHVCFAFAQTPQSMLAPRCDRDSNASLFVSVVID